MRRILVTGANKGIGLAIVTAILDEQPDCFVFLGARDADRGRAARDQLVAGDSDRAARVEVVDLDVTSDVSVDRAAARFCADGPVYGVVNNAGIGSGALDRVLDVNLHGVRRVCEALLPQIPEGGRIVQVSSASGPSFLAGCRADRVREFIDPGVTRATLDRLVDEALAIASGGGSFAEHGLGDGSAYGLSKALLNTYTLILARENPDLHVNACTPGFIETDLTRRYAESSGKSPEELGMKPPAAGARSPMHLLFGELQGNGRFYGSDGLRSPLDRYRSPGTPAYTGT